MKISRTGRPRRSHASRGRRIAKRPVRQALSSERQDPVPVGSYLLDRQGRIRDVNEKGAAILGFSMEWLLGRPFVVFVAPKHVREFLDSLTEARRQPVDRLLNLVLLESNRRHPAQVSISTSLMDSQLMHRLTVVDMTDIRKTERQLQESLSNWDTLIHHAPETIMTIDHHGRITFVNKGIWGYSVEMLMETNLFDHVPEKEHPKILHCLSEAFRQSRASTCEISGIDDDWTVWYLFSFGGPHQLVINKRGVPVTTTTTTTTTLLIREISEHKRMEETLRVSGEHLRDFAARLEAVREEERTRVAREIHDDLGQALTALKLDLSWLQGKRVSPSMLKSKLTSIIGQVDETIDRVRRISSELRPPLLDNLGLIPAIDWHLSELRKHARIRARMTSNVEDLDLPMEVSVAVFRVAQEALTNVVRHAKASRVEVHIRFEQNELHVSVIDNGVGIGKNNKSDLRSLGIVGMKERISRIGGAFSISSEPGKGTRLDLKVPVNHD